MEGGEERRRDQHGSGERSLAGSVDAAEQAKRGDDRHLLHLFPLFPPGRGACGASLLRSFLRLRWRAGETDVSVVTTTHWHGQEAGSGEQCTSRAVLLRSKVARHKRLWEGPLEGGGEEGLGRDELGADDNDAKNMSEPRVWARGGRRRQPGAGRATDLARHHLAAVRFRVHLEQGHVGGVGQWQRTPRPPSLTLVFPPSAAGSTPTRQENAPACSTEA